MPQAPHTISAAAAILANLCFVCWSLGLCWLLFSILPLTLGLLQLPVNGFLFAAALKRRHSALRYALLIHGVLVLTVFAVYAGILTFGRAPFEFLLDLQWWMMHRGR